MFTGIITDIGRITRAETAPGRDLRVTVEAGHDLADLALGASIACSGVCLTVTSKAGRAFTVDVSAETLSRTASGMWAEGRRLNLERSLRVGDELGGHIVTGHVDGVGRIESVERDGGSLRLRVSAPRPLAGGIAPKGSIAVDGVSLTVNAVEDRQSDCVFELNIIPHTAQWTTLGEAHSGQSVNLEIDVLARYLQRLYANRM